MRSIFILSAAVLCCGVGSLQAQVAKQVEVTRTYIPEVAKAVKLPVVPDMTDTVRLRPEIDYSIAPLALATNLSTEPFRPASVTYWEFNRPLPFYLKAGAGVPFNSVFDFYASTQNSGTGYAVGYLNHAGDWARIRNDFGAKPASWRMSNRLGAAAGKYLGRHLLEGSLDVTDRIYRDYAFDGMEASCIRYDGSSSSWTGFPFEHVSGDRRHFDDAALRLRIGDDFTDLEKFNFDVELRGDYFLDASTAAVFFADRERYRELSGGGGIRLGKAFGRHAFELKADFDGAWRNVRDYSSTQLLVGLHYSCRADRFRWSAGLDYVRDAVGREAAATESGTEYANRFLPAASIVYDPAGGRFMLYAGLTGEVRRNDMRTLSRLNPYVGSASIVPNTALHRIAAGLKGATGRGRFSYDLHAEYAYEKNALQWAAFFLPDGRIPEADGEAVGYLSYYAPFATTLKDLSLHAELAWRPSSRFAIEGEVHAHSFKGAARYGTCPLAYGRPQLTARLRGEYRARKVSLELEARLQSVRHWTVWTLVYDGIVGSDTDIPMTEAPSPESAVFDYKVPVTVDLAARFNWFVSHRTAFFVEGRNLCDAKLYDWAFYRGYGVGFTAGVKLQF